MFLFILRGLGLWQALAMALPWPWPGASPGRARALATKGCSRAPLRNPRRQIVCAPRFSPSASNQFRVRVLVLWGPHPTKPWRWLGVLHSQSSPIARTDEQGEHITLVDMKTSLRNYALLCDSKLSFISNMSIITSE